MRPIFSDLANDFVGSASTDAVLRDADRAARCAAWARGDGLERHERPGLLYRPTTPALWAFRGHPSLPPPPGGRYDFLRDATHPESLASLDIDEVYGLYQAAAAGLLRGAFAPDVPWHLRPHAVALLEPYRRLATEFGSSDFSVLTSTLKVAEEEICLWTQRSWPPAAQRVWQSREQPLFAALAGVQAGSFGAIARPRVMREVKVYLLGAACAVGVLCALDDNHPRFSVFGHCLSLACAMLMLSAAMAVAARDR